MGEYALGQSVPRSEDPRLLRGGGRYVDDMVLPGMVFGHVLRSPHPHARIVSIETARAAAAPGVLAVLTGADWANSGYGDLPTGAGQKRRDGSALYVPEYPALVAERVRRVGDYVAFVIAETKDQAKDERRHDRDRDGVAKHQDLDRVHLARQFARRHRHQRKAEQRADHPQHAPQGVGKAERAAFGRCGRIGHHAV